MASAEGLSAQGSVATSRVRGNQRQLTLHLALVVHNDAAVVLEVDEDTVLPPPGLALPHHHGRHHCRGGGDRLGGEMRVECGWPGGREGGGANPPHFIATCTDRIWRGRGLHTNDQTRTWGPLTTRHGLFQGQVFTPLEKGVRPLNTDAIIFS